MSIVIYILIMAGVTYLIRMIPFTAFRREIKSKFFKSFFYYVPYAVLSAMTIPAIFYATGDLTSAIAGTAVAPCISILQYSPYRCRSGCICFGFCCGIDFKVIIGLILQSYSISGVQPNLKAELSSAFSYYIHISSSPRNRNCRFFYFGILYILL